MLQQLALRDFRNFEQLDVELPHAGLAIVGENGHGKTNLLEAVSYLGLFRSLRGARDSDVIRFGAPAFHVRGRLSAPSRYATVSAGYERSTKRKRAMLDGVEQERLSLAFGAVPSVCFSPVDVALVAGGPAERRHFLDVALALSAPQYLVALQRYRSALRQRNAALRLAQRAGPSHANAHDANVAVWEPALAEQGGMLAAVRRDWCNAHAEQFTQICAAIGERLAVSMRYASADSRRLQHAPSPADAQAESAADASASDLAVMYRNALTEQRSHEMRRGITLAGPHRDDIQLLLGDRELRTFGSAGQQRTAAIALRMLEFATVRTFNGAPPLLLLDDPFAELDANRSARILELLEERGVGQVLLAVPRDEDIPRAFTRLERRSMVNGDLR